MKRFEIRSQTDLRQLAERHGIATSWTDSEQRVHHVEADTLHALLDMVRTDRDSSVPRVIVSPVGQSVSLVVPRGYYCDGHLEIDPRSQPPDASGGDERVGSGPAGLHCRDNVVTVNNTVPVGRHCLRLHGRRVPSIAITVLITPRSACRWSGDRALSVFVPTYALHDESPDPTLDRSIGGLAELDRFAAGVAPHGVAAIATLPLNATFCGRGREPFDPSPYSPVSRRHWNELFADLRDLPVPAGLPDLDPRKTPADPRTQPRADWRRAAAMVDAVLDQAVSVERFRSEIAAWCNERPDVVSYAMFRSSVERTGAPPAASSHRGESSIDVADDVALRHALGQRLMVDQMTAMAAKWKTRNQVLALDLPVGSHPEGWETWSSPNEFERGASVGAPPDSFFQGGQNWGFAPLHPERSRDAGHRVWHDTIAAACSHTGLLRVDHVMAIHRLWWIPAGAEPSQGAYVRYPAEELWADLVITSHLTETVIVGEDLGTVPPEVVDARRHRGVLGMHEEQFVMDSPDATSLPDVPDDVIAGIRTHDMVPFHAFVTGADRAQRRELGLEQVDTPEARRQNLQSWRKLVEEDLGHAVGEDPTELLDAALERLAKSSAPIVSVDLDDVLAVDLPHNVPGVSDHSVAWCKMAPLTVDALIQSPAVTGTLGRLAEWRRRANR